MYIHKTSESLVRLNSYFWCGWGNQCKLFAPRAPLLPPTTGAATTPPPAPNPFKPPRDVPRCSGLSVPVGFSSFFASHGLPSALNWTCALSICICVSLFSAKRFCCLTYRNTEYPTSMLQTLATRVPLACSRFDVANPCNKLRSWCRFTPNTTDTSDPDGKRLSVYDTDCHCIKAPQDIEPQWSLASCFLDLSMLTKMGEIASYSL